MISLSRLAQVVYVFALSLALALLLWQNRSQAQFRGTPGIAGMPAMGGLQAGGRIIGLPGPLMMMPLNNMMTPYPEVFMRLAEVFASPPMHGSKLVVDYTGVGRPVLDMLRKGKVGTSVTPLFVTSGKNSSDDGRGGWLVPRQELAATLQVLLQSRRLRVAPALPEAAMLAKELATDFPENLSFGLHSDYRRT
jgi:hypothetical protein